MSRTPGYLTIAAACHEAETAVASATSLQAAGWTPEQIRCLAQALGDLGQVLGSCSRDLEFAVEAMGPDQLNGVPMTPRQSDGRRDRPPSIHDLNHLHENVAFLRLAHEVQRLFWGEWTTEILVVLQAGPQRYTEIRDRVRSLGSVLDESGHPRMLHEGVLTRTLQTMTKYGLITRTQVTFGVPPVVHYALAPMAAEALKAWQPLVDWAADYASYHLSNGDSA